MPGATDDRLQREAPEVQISAAEEQIQEIDPAIDRDRIRVVCLVLTFLLCLIS